MPIAVSRSIATSKPLRWIADPRLRRRANDRMPEVDRAVELVAATVLAPYPLFIDALVRHACSEGAPSGSGSRLDDALWQRVEVARPERMIAMMAPGFA